MDKRWTVERVLATPKREVMDAVKRGEGPPPEVMAELIMRALGRKVDRLRPMDRPSSGASPCGDPYPSGRKYRPDNSKAR